MYTQIYLESIWFLDSQTADLRDITLEEEDFQSCSTSVSEMVDTLVCYNNDN